MNTKYNVIWVKGAAVAGETNSIVYIYDTRLPLRSVRFLVIVIVPTIKCTAESEITKISETQSCNYPYIQGDSRGICTTLGNDSMSDSKQKSSYKHGSDFEWLRSYGHFLIPVHALM